MYFFFQNAWTMNNNYVIWNVTVRMTTILHICLFCLYVNTYISMMKCMPHRWRWLSSHYSCRMDQFGIVGSRNCGPSQRIRKPLQRDGGHRTACKPAYNCRCSSPLAQLAWPLDIYTSIYSENSRDLHLVWMLYKIYENIASKSNYSKYIYTVYNNTEKLPLWSKSRLVY